MEVIVFGKITSESVLLFVKAPLLRLVTVNFLLLYSTFSGILIFVVSFFVKWSTQTVKSVNDVIV